jgi:NTP pyrophosphatase (non-canonical NTP hydrolase)
MTINDYSEKAWSTAIYPNKGKDIYYPLLGLGGETGEVFEKIKKIIRDKNGKFEQSDLEEIEKELGDIVWYINALCKTLGFNLEKVCQKNIDKLKSRQERNVLHGKGDNR